MEFTKQAVLVMVKNNPVIQLKTNYKVFETLINNWLARQSLPVETAIQTAVTAVVGAASSICYHKCVSGPSTVPQSLLFKARNWAVLTGVHKGITCVMKRTRGKEDVKSSLVAGFGAGVMFSLVTGMRGPNVISVGVFFALLSGGAFKAGEKFSSAQSKDELYKEPGNDLQDVKTPPEATL